MKLWGGRFTGERSAAADHFHSSIAFDQRLYRQDIAGSRAHAEMLGRQGIIPEQDARAICDALGEILRDIDEGQVAFEEDAEDIHMNIEKILTARLGEAGKRLHTGRSRNDQVATDMRMYVKEANAGLQDALGGLLAALAALAKNHVATIMPGYTHLQRAQPVTFAHHMLAYGEMFKRDLHRLREAYTRADALPLGAGALAGTSFPLDREFTRQKLGFARLAENSLDAVSDRDFCADLLYALAMIMMHASRLCEELILWSSHEFRFVELADSYATGSSIMPQKKNPDMAELIRGKTGRVYGLLMGLLTMLKGLPLAYNKDMQEDKEAVFDGVDTVALCLPVLTGMLATLRVNGDAMAQAAAGGFTNATDAADWLAAKGVPFRDAHGLVGKLVLYCASAGKTLEALSLEEYRAVSPVFDEGIYEAVSLRRCVAARAQGPAEEHVLAQIRGLEEFLAAASAKAGREIERKFLPQTLPGPLEGYPCQRITQTYLSAHTPVIRLRRIWDGAESFVLTVKGGGALARTEFELPLTPDQYARLLEKCAAPPLEKNRYRVPLAGGLTAELDIYEGPLAGLTTVEVEFPTQAEAEAFAPPGWFGRDVTYEPGYKNSSLALWGLPEGHGAKTAASNN
jgi:argininosuccinate lyase